MTISVISLNQLLEDINKTFLPSPYTIFLTKIVYNPNCIDIIYSLLCKFGTHIKDSFFDIPIETVKQLFDLIYDDNDKYIVIQNEIEYIIQKVDYGEYGEYEEVICNNELLPIMTIGNHLHNLDTYYNRLKPRQDSINSNNSNTNNSNSIHTINDDIDL